VVSESSPLADRYGNSAQSKRVRRAWAWAGASVTVVALTAWMLWANPLEIGPSATARDLGHTLMDGSAVSVQFEATVTPNHSFACAVSALNSAFAIVGWKVIAFDASSTRSQTVTTVVKTTEPAVTGLVSNCWLT
jgi:hypothetical protein